MDPAPTNTFESISPAEFFYRNRQMAGFGNPTQALFSAVRELVENSLDACEQACVAPQIDVRIDTVSPGVQEVVVADNGSGVPYEHVPEAFGRVLFGNKFAVRQQRGTFGLGVTMAVLYGQITTDTPVVVHTRTGDDEGRLFKIAIDVENNRPIVLGQTKVPRNEIGTTVTIRLKGDLRRSRDRIIEYTRLTTVTSPHARLTLSIDKSFSMTVGPHTSALPTPSRVCRPHPRAADVELLRRLL